MKKVLIALLLTTTLFAQDVDKGKLSEAFGHLIVRHLINPDYKFDTKKIIKGIHDAQNGKPSPLTEEEYEEAIFAIQENLYLEAAEKNLEQATAFLQENEKKEGVNVAHPQIHYKVEKEGSGKEVTQDSTPLIQYKGSLIDGTEFAASDEPISLPMSQTIPGFSKGLVGMKEGEKRTIYVHPELAYGMSGALPPNSLLIFEVEVLEANPLELIADESDLSPSGDTPEYR